MAMFQRFILATSIASFAAATYLAMHSATEMASLRGACAALSTSAALFWVLDRKFATKK